jgi:hypothetical protein
MDARIAAEALVALMVFLGLVGLFFGPYQWLVVDWGRNSMFAARDELFDIAAASDDGLNDPSYQAVRAALNSNIRFAHSASLGQLLLHMHTVSPVLVRSARTARMSAETIRDPDLRTAAIRIAKRIERVAFRLLMLRSPVTTVVLFVLILAVMLFSRATGRGRPDPSFKRRLQRYEDGLQIEATTA